MIAPASCNKSERGKQWLAAGTFAEQMAHTWLRCEGRQQHLSFATQIQMRATLTNDAAIASCLGYLVECGEVPTCGGAGHGFFDRPEARKKGGTNASQKYPGKHWNN